ncbi:MAG: hypothetical protein RSA98_10835 [Odoribacter sp.]
MRIISLIWFLLLLSCGEDNLQIPPQSAIRGLASPIYLQADTTLVHLTDYFSQPLKIKKIILPDGIEMLWTNDKKTLKLWSHTSLKPFQNLKIRYDGYNYDIPIFKEKTVQFEELKIQITTDELSGDTIYLRTSLSPVHWIVYFQNYQLSDRSLLISGDRLGIILPKVATKLHWAELRVWAFDEEDVSNKIVLPLENGRVIIAATNIPLDQFSTTDCLPACFSNPDEYPYVASIFASPKKSFKLLHQQVMMHKLFPKDICIAKEKDRFFFAGRQSGQSIDAIYNKWMQCLFFYATIPGIFINEEEKDETIQHLYAPDNKKQWLDKKYEDLKALRRSDMALMYGDFILLRSEDQVYAYLRSYFGKDVVVVFNKGEDAIILKLDLPHTKRNNAFNSLLEGRFSYDNSKIILDIPANGVEVIYN